MRRKNSASNRRIKHLGISTTFENIEFFGISDLSALLTIDGDENG
jgi:hypothetical protein